MREEGGEAEETGVEDTDFPSSRSSGLGHAPNTPDAKLALDVVNEQTHGSEKSHDKKGPSEKVMTDGSLSDLKGDVAPRNDGVASEDVNVVPTPRAVNPFGKGPRKHSEEKLGLFDSLKKIQGASN